MLQHSAGAAARWCLAKALGEWTMQVKVRLDGFELAHTLARRLQYWSLSYSGTQTGDEESKGRFRSAMVRAFYITVR